MTVGELKAVLAPLDDALEIEIIAVYEDGDGDEIARSFDLQAVGAELDSDTAREYARFDCAEPE
jgi:hypothetical protein